MESSNLIYTCYSGVDRSGENLVRDHTLTMVIAGRSQAYYNGGEITTEVGGFRFMRRNSLVKFTKYPSPTEGYKVLSVVLDSETLREYSRQVDTSLYKGKISRDIVNLRPSTLLKSYFTSLTPYLDDKNSRFNQISRIKIMEAASILLDIDPAFAGVLFDFAEPGKIDLEGFMQEHFRYNVSLPDLARLTGRSISSFKRDFMKLFGTTPYEWLKARRLEEAYYLMDKKRLPPGDVAFLSGFVNYSHFSRSFKERYNIAPSSLEK